MKFLKYNMKLALVIGIGIYEKQVIISFQYLLNKSIPYTPNIDVL